MNTATITPIPASLAGTWFVDLTGDLTDTCSYVFVQDGGTITGGTMSCASLGPGDFVGVVDGDSFELTGSIFGGDFNAIGSTDGATLEGTWNVAWAANPSGVSGTLSASTNPPTPLPTSTATPEPTSEVLQATEVPTETPPLVPDVRPQTSGAIMSVGDLPLDPGVIATNVAIAFALLAILLISSSVFNDTLAENRYEIEDMIGKALSPLRRLFGFLGGTVSVVLSTRLGHLLALPAMLLLTGVIYSFNESDVGLNTGTLLLFFSLVIGIGIITVIYEGGQALVVRNRFHVQASMDVIPFALGIAAFFVLLSRLVDFQAPILYGFVAAASILRATDVDESQEAQAVAIPSFILLGISLLAWGLLGPLRELSGDSDHWFVHLPGESAAIVFAGGIEGLVFAMIPLTFTDGIKVFHWQKLVWLVLFVVPTFLFAWVILNPEAEAFSALVEGRVVFAFGLAMAYAAMTFGVWAYFLRRKEPAPPAGGLYPPPSGKPPDGGGLPNGEPQLVPPQRAPGLVIKKTSPNHFTVVDEGRT